MNAGSGSCAKRALVLAVVALTFGVVGPIAHSLGQAGSVDLSVTYSPHAAHASCNVNLGPTGAVAWMRGYHFVVTSIQQQSPAHGELMLGDVVVGAAGRSFGPEVDPRMTLGNAIGEAEAKGQPLKLLVQRDGKTRTVAITLARLGAFAKTWPADCEKSRIIVEQACQSLLDVQMPDGNVVTDGSLGTFFSGLLFLGTGEAKYLDPARRAAYRAMEYDYAHMSLNNWTMGYGGMLMAEYYLATGDDTVLPKLAEVVKWIAEGQMLCGSWGHSSPAGGYGALNQPGLACAIAMVLAKECGVEVDQAALDKALAFFGKYAGLGAVPYGDHRPYRSLDDNGKNSSAAVLFHLAGREDIAQMFAASVAESYWLREDGHTGGFFSLMWGPIGASLAGEVKLRKFLDYQQWYFNMGRQWTGSLTMLPYREALTRFDDSSYIEFGGDFTTGGLALAYVLPRKKIRILGAGPSVFGAKLTGDLRTARDRYVARDWEGFDAVMNSIEPTDRGNRDEIRWIAQLRNVRALSKASTERVFAEIECNIRDGGAYRASQQFEALKRSLGDKADPRLAELEERFANGTTAWYVREGAEFYEKWQGMVGFGVKTWVPQGVMAKRMLQGVPTPRLPYWEPLSATSQLTPQEWRSLLIEPDAKLPDGWTKPGFDDSDWHGHQAILTRFNAEPATKGDLPTGPVAARRTFTLDHKPTTGQLRVRVQTVRPAITTVYLNGTQIAHLERGQRGGYAAIPLDDRALDLLKEGKNVLAVTCDKQGGANNALDVGLEIDRRGVAPRHLPVDRYDTIHTAALPADAETALRVSQAKDEFREALTQSYLAKSVAQLVKDLGTDIGYHRLLVEDALVAKGLDGVKAAIAEHSHADWKTRAGVLGVIHKAWGAFSKGQDKEGLAYLRTQIPVVARHTEDPHLWVRTMACDALGRFGADAKSTVPALMHAAGDSEEWVRQAAVAALPKVGADSAEVLTAIDKAIATRNSAFNITHMALQTVTQSKAEVDRKSLAILVQIIRHPPEGGGGALLSQAIDVAFDMDPDGQTLIPVLIEAAADKTHLSRQRGNPRGKAIATLGRYGTKAVSAAVVLRGILADDSKKAKGLHEAAQKALDAILGTTTQDKDAEQDAKA